MDGREKGRREKKSMEILTTMREAARQQDEAQIQEWTRGRKYGKRDSRKTIPSLSINYRNSPLVTRDRDTWQSLPSFRSRHDFLLRERGRRKEEGEKEVSDRVAGSRDSSGETSSSGRPDDDVTGNVRSEFQRPQNGILGR